MMKLMILAVFLTTARANLRVNIYNGRPIIDTSKTSTEPSVPATRIIDYPAQSTNVGYSRTVPIFIYAVPAVIPSYESRAKNSTVKEPHSGAPAVTSTNPQTSWFYYNTHVGASVGASKLFNVRGKVRLMLRKPVVKLSSYIGPKWQKVVHIIHPVSGTTERAKTSITYLTDAPAINCTIDSTMTSTINSTVDPAMKPTTNVTVGPAIPSTMTSTVGPTMGPTTNSTIDPAITSSTAELAITSTTAAPASTSTTADPALTSTTADPALTSTTADPALTSTTADPALTSTTADPALTSITAAPALTSTTAGPALTSTTADSALTSTTADPALTSTTADPALTSTTNDPALMSTTADAALMSSTADLALTSTTADPALTSTTADPALTSSTADPALTSTTADPALTSTTADPDEYEDLRFAPASAINQRPDAGTIFNSRTNPLNTPIVLYVPRNQKIQQGQIYYPVAPIPTRSRYTNLSPGTHQQIRMRQ